MTFPHGTLYSVGLPLPASNASSMLATGGARRPVIQPLKCLSVAKLDWQKARQREAARDVGAAGKPRPETNAKRQAALAEFVRRHGLRCFKCGGEKAEWAKTGVSKRGAWAICTECVTEVTAPR